VREQISPALARKRADRIKSYLKDVWKVDDKRVAVKVGKPFSTGKTTTTTPQQAEEERRVEILSDTPDVLAELRAKDVTRTIKPPVLRLKLDVKAPEGLRDWKIEAVQAGETARSLKTFTGTGATPETLDWAVTDASPDSLPRTKDDIILKLEATDVTGKTVRAPLTFVPTDVLTPESKRQNSEPDERVDVVNVYGALYGGSAGGSAGVNRSDVLRDADSATTQALAVTAQKITALVKPQSTVTVTATTDATNQTAQASSEANAQHVAEMLASVPAAKRTVRSAGVSTTFTNALPEGRFYNRTVMVEVRTPLNQAPNK
jgi:hypothetical protein